MQTLTISGGSSGIGLATAKRFAQAGYRIFNLDVQEPWEEIPSAIYIPCDVSRVSEIKEAVDKITQQTSRVDALVCNAGIHLSANVQQTSEEDFQRVMDVNFKGCFFLTQAILPLMIPHRRGAIAYLGSDQSLIAKTNSAAYGASKAALASLAKTTAIDYASVGIRANLIAAGTIDTPLYRSVIQRYCQRTGADFNVVNQAEADLQPLGRLGTTAEVAELIYFLCSEQAGFITGAVYPIDGGYTAR